MAQFLRPRGQPRAAQLMGLESRHFFFLLLFVHFPSILSLRRLSLHRWRTSGATHSPTKRRCARDQHAIADSRGECSQEPQQRLRVQRQEEEEGKKKGGGGERGKNSGDKVERVHSCVSQRLVMSLSNHFLMPLAERSEFTQIL